MNDDEIEKIIQICVELCAEVCDSRSRSLSRDDLFTASNEAQKCGSAIRAKLGDITDKLVGNDTDCWHCYNLRGVGGDPYCTVCKK